jgi:hypothetical protein
MDLVSKYGIGTMIKFTVKDSKTRKSLNTMMKSLVLKLISLTLL